MALSKRIRFEVLRRDSHTCRYCGGKAPGVILTVDHVVPAALGGADSPGNLVTACRDCNSGKSSVPASAGLVADVETDALRWATAMKMAAEQARAEGEAHEQLRAIEADEVLFIWNSYAEDTGDERWELPNNWFERIAMWRDAGVPQETLKECAKIALQHRNADLWRYFCGCVWRRLNEIQERARTLLTEAAVAP